MSAATSELEMERKRTADEAAARAEATPEDDDDDETATAGEPGGEDDDDDDETATAGEPAPQAVAPALSEKQIEARMRAMDRESDRHATNVQKIMGEDFAYWHECPLCRIPGYVPTPDGSPADPLQRAAVLAAMGEEAEPELKQHPNMTRCETCGGPGEVKTGGTSPTNSKRICPECNGDGAVPTNLPPVYTLPPAPPSSVPAPVGATYVPMPEGPPPIPGAMWDFERGNWTLPPSIPS